MPHTRCSTRRFSPTICPRTSPPASGAEAVAVRGTLSEGPSIVERRSPIPSTAATSSAAAIGTQNVHPSLDRVEPSPFARASVRSLSSWGGPLAAAARRALWIAQTTLNWSQHDEHSSRWRSSSRSSSGVSSPSTYGPRSSAKRSSLMLRLRVERMRHDPMEALDGGRGPALDRPQRNAGPAGDLALGQAPEVGEGQDLPVLVRDAGESACQVPTVHIRLRLRAARYGSQRVLSDRERSYPASPVQVHGAVAGDAVEPGRETRPFRLERFCSPPDAREGVLDELLGQLRVAEQPESRGVHRTRVAVVELQEGPLVASRYPADQGLIPCNVHL